MNAEELVVDFDLYVYDEQGQEIAQDTSRNPDAQCMAKPTLTGPLTLKIKAPKAHLKPTHKDKSIHLWIEGIEDE